MGSKEITVQSKTILIYQAIKIYVNKQITYVRIAYTYFYSILMCLIVYTYKNTYVCTYENTYVCTCVKYFRQTTLEIIFENLY